MIVLKDGIGVLIFLIINTSLLVGLVYWLVRRERLLHSFAPRINPSRVPEHLRPFIPLAAKFGIGDDGIRYDVASAAPVEEKRQLREVFDFRSEDIDQWIDSFGDEPMSDEAAAFMYMLLATDELTAFGDPIFSYQASPVDHDS
ncbi:MAG: hypothetical protein KAU23_00575 [Anaerolineales bacterium]|nr:hypothetical protein [Anaerolineales bacterium]